jgi:SagB-type dehydrogenase family enzyme
MNIKRLSISPGKRVSIAAFLLADLVLMLSLPGTVTAVEEDMKVKTVVLPKPSLKGVMPLEEAMNARRSIRNYSDRELTIEQVSQLLWAAQGITDMRGLRTAPSAGATYPLEVYIVKSDGLFRYRPQGHKLITVRSEDLRRKLADAAWGQGFIAEAPASIVISSVYDRVSSRYGQRGVRYADIEAGHAAQNVHLEAVALGLASVPVGAFDDEAVSGLLELIEGEKPIYIIPVGYER